MQEMETAHFNFLELPSPMSPPSFPPEGGQTVPTPCPTGAISPSERLSIQGAILEHV